jgi:hypothetical protein
MARTKEEERGMRRDHAGRKEKGEKKGKRSSK